MGAAVSKKSSKRLPLHSKVKYLKTTPFFLYLQDDLLDEFAQCFPYTKRCKEGETINIDHENVYIVAYGELELKTILPKSSGKIETRGFLCKKHPGDIVYQRNTQKLATEKVCFYKLRE
jgi:hypothetical protein